MSEHEKQQQAVINVYSTQDCQEDDGNDLKSFFKNQLSLQMQQLRNELKADFTQSISASESNIKSYIDTKYKELDASIKLNTNHINHVSVKADSVTTLAKELETATQSHDDRIGALEEGNKKLAEEIIQLKKDNDVKSIHISTLQYRMEDQTNRNCRKTLIIKGIKEIPEENNRKDGWNATRKRVSTMLAKLCQLDSEDIDYWIERVHRGKKDEQKEGPPNIHACFYDWNKAQLILKEFIKNGRGQGVYVEQRYGPNTSYRQNQAKKERRTLLDNKTITNGYVGFPSQLMVKYKETDLHFKLHKDFSRIEVPLRVPKKEQASVD